MELDAESYSSLNISEDLYEIRYFPEEIGEKMIPLGYQTSWLIAGNRVRSVVSAVQAFLDWRSVARCPQTASSGWDMPDGTRWLQLKQICADRQTGYCTLSKPGIPGTLRPGDGKSFRFLWSLKHEQTHVQTHGTHTHTHTHIQVVCQIPQSSKGNRGQMRKATEWEL